MQISGLIADKAMEGSWQDTRSTRPAGAPEERRGVVQCFYSPNDCRPQARRISVHQWADGEVEIMVLEFDGKYSEMRVLAEAALTSPSEKELADKLRALTDTHMRQIKSGGLESEVGRLLLPEGFTVAETGGGCEAWVRDTRDGCYQMITAADGVSLPKGPDFPVNVGVHGDEGGFRCTMAPDLLEALKAIEDGRIPETISADVEETVSFEDLGSGTPKPSRLH